MTHTHTHVHTHIRTSACCNDRPSIFMTHAYPHTMSHTHQQSLTHAHKCTHAHTLVYGGRIFQSRLSRKEVWKEVRCFGKLFLSEQANEVHLHHLETPKRILRYGTQ